MVAYRAISEHPVKRKDHGHEEDRRRPLALIAALAVATPANAGKAVTYKGKTSSGHRIKFKLNRGRVQNLIRRRARELHPDQGRLALIRRLRGVPLPRPGPDEAQDAPQRPGQAGLPLQGDAINQDLWLKRRGRRAITGRMRLQYSFLLPKYPIGTYTIYSCLGGATFKAKA